MVNYQQGKIYKLVGNGLTYIGSTCEPTLARRLAGHVGDYKRYLNGKRRYFSSFECLKNNDYAIVLIEKFQCDSKDELHKRERYYIETNECVNMVIPTRTKKQYYQNTKKTI